MQSKIANQKRKKWENVLWVVSTVNKNHQNP
jgi:hypothetical protein